MDPSPPRLTSCQTKALDVLEREGNVFLTGAAGTGKSFLLDRYLEGKPSADFPVVASTGAAAVIVGGRTFHSFFGLGILEGGAEMAIAKALRNRKVTNRMQRACSVIIDEISMLSGTTLRAAETVARRARGKDAPWGGLRIIAVGDFAQLPPVTPGHESKDWAFRHPVWKESDFEPALLSTVMRTQDIEFLEILNFVREGIVNERVRSFLDRRTGTLPGHSETTRLYPHRAEAEQYNLRRLDSLPGKLFEFPTQYIGHEKHIEAAKRVVPIPETLLLKSGALIMMRKNDANEGMRYVNGSLGRIQRIEKETLFISLLSGDEIEVGKDKFSTLDGDGNEVMQAWNFPVTLAWATTIHKSQGASLDRVTIDLHELWEPGQAYVALSRVRSGDGLCLERWSESSVRAEPLVTAFYDALTERARKYVPRPFFRVPERPAYQEAPAYSRSGKRKQATRAERMEDIENLLRCRLPLDVIASSLGIKLERVLLYLEALTKAGKCPDLSYLLTSFPAFPRVREAFRVSGADTLRPVFDALEGKVSFNALRLARCMMRVGAKHSLPDAAHQV